MRNNVYFLCFLLLKFSNVFSFEIWCEDKMYSVEEKQTLIYVSVHCLHCSQFVKEKNDTFEQNSKPLPWLIFKENKPEVIQKYVTKNQLKNKICIINKVIKKCLKQDVTPQIISCFNNEK